MYFDGQNMCPYQFEKHSWLEFYRLWKEQVLPSIDYCHKTQLTGILLAVERTLPSIDYCHKTQLIGILLAVERTLPLLTIVTKHSDWNIVGCGKNTALYWLLSQNTVIGILLLWKEHCPLLTIVTNTVDWNIVGCGKNTALYWLLSQSTIDWNSVGYRKNTALYWLLSQIQLTRILLAVERTLPSIDYCHKTQFDWNTIGLWKEHCPLLTIVTKHSWLEVLLVLKRTLPSIDYCHKTTVDWKYCWLWKEHCPLLTIVTKHSWLEYCWLWKEHCPLLTSLTNCKWTWIWMLLIHHFLSFITTADVGGFFKNPEPELLTRWYQVRTQVMGYNKTLIWKPKCYLYLITQPPQWTFDLWYRLLPSNHSSEPTPTWTASDVSHGSSHPTWWILYGRLSEHATLYYHTGTLHSTRHLIQEFLLWGKIIMTVVLSSD